ncbi:hypothetical protein Poli38472_010921 [Pythium oligandrum]|uniref:Protein kinase domain-containing protein n=1 Tax=Pythium oligandrum TaxID=41045 RepID=A0A8K1FKM2_PYTOL|nr:hypothetical protein Poli38472_010921 [Pythium oligandrum]|eukprot:TMW61858.1 hypothetical protein Poli38472_010921 [Pythium oligandrum]
MRGSRRIWSLLASLSLASTTVLAHSQAVNTSIPCPALSQEADQKPMLISNCQGVCGYEGFCVFFPYQYQDRCYGLFDSRCMQGDVCTFECFRKSPTSVYLYRTWDQLSDWMPRFIDDGKALVNASLVNSWSADDLSAVPKFGLFSGLTIYDVDDYDAGVYIPPIETLDMQLPDNIYLSEWNATSISIGSIKCPEFPTEAQHYDGLKTLWLENCGLTEFPWGESTAPRLETLFLGKNRIKELPNLPPSVQRIDLSGNQLDGIPPGLKDLENLTSIHLRHNPLGNIDAGDFPETMSGILILKNTSITKLPTNLNRLTKLRELSLSYNDFGSDFDASDLPPAIRTLEIAYCGLTSLPKLSADSTIDTLDISGNAIPVDELSNLPPTLSTLYFQDAGLKRIPVAVSSTMKTPIDLDFSNNPIEKIEEGELPETVGILVLNNTPLTNADIAYSAFPPRLTTVNITFSQLEEIPESLINGERKQTLNLAHNKIKTINATDAVKLYLQYNELETFDDAAAYAKYIDLSYNKLTSFKNTNADILKILLLRGNNLTTIPDSIFSLRNLQILDLRDNPITDYILTAQDWIFFQRVPVVRMDATQLRANCKDLVRFKEHLVCDPNGSLEPVMDASSDGSTDGFNVQKAEYNSSISTVTIALIVVALTLAVLIAAFVWYRHRKRHPSSQPYSSELDTKSTVHSDNYEVMLWCDEELLRHRLDPKLVQVERHLAAGTYGEVFLATYEGQRVVVKRLKNRDSSRAEIQQFVSEIKMMATFRFPKIVRFVGVVWTKESDIALVTEYMENGDLRAHLDKNKRRARDGWTIAKLRIALDIAEALVYLHSLDPPMIHRDLKSCNVLVDHEMSACLSDFGTTRAVDDSRTMTAEVGTALWMAPEVLSGLRYDQSADIYSLGVILSELDTHELPFRDDDQRESAQAADGTFIMGLVASGTIRVKFLPTCPADIVKLATQCTELDPAVRPSTLEVAYSLRSILRQEMQSGVRRSSKSNRASLSSRGRQI